ncbi:MAG: hypothetical protein ACRDHM_01305 [Actinomycetota bacterium]
MSASRVVRNKTATRFTDRVLLAIVTSLVLTTAACSGEAGVEETAAHDSGALDEPAQPADRPVPPSPMALGALAYVLDGDLYVADWNGANPVRIANGRPGTGGCTDEYGAEGTIWSPDGRYLAVGRDARCHDGATSWRDAVIIDPEGEVVASIPSEGWLISWSPDSKRVAVWITWGETIGVYGLHGERQAVLELPGGLMAPGDFDPVWSSDGASLLVPHGVEIPLDGSTPRQLPPDDPRSQDAAYSPDGSRVAFVDHLEQDGSLVVAAPDGSDAQEVIAPRVERPVWSPTGDRIAFIYSERGGQASTELHVVDVATGEVTSLTTGGSELILNVIEFSPEGDRILFSRTENRGRGNYLRQSSLWSINADGSDLNRLVSGTVWGDWQSLSPTG